MEHVKHTIKFDLEPKEPFTVFALEPGGFLPLCFTSAPILYVDRNIISKANNILQNGNHKDNKSNSWWFEFLNNSGVSLNAMTSALEGNNRKIPTFDEFCDEFDKNSNTLREYFPNANVIHYTKEHYKAAYLLLMETTSDYISDVNLLMKAAPLLVDKVSISKSNTLEKKLFDIALSSGPQRPSFALLACLSCLYKGNETESIGRELIKPKLNYSHNMAHNTFNDLWALNLLVQANAKLNTKIGYCTSDKGLLKFSLALRAKPDGKSTKKGFTINIEFTKDMFQKLGQDDLISLKGRFEEMASNMKLIVSS